MTAAKFIPHLQPVEYAAVSVLSSTHHALKRTAMVAVNEIDRLLRDFQVGRASFERLTDALGRVLAAGTSSDQEFDQALIGLVEDGRLPHDLAVLIRQQTHHVADKIADEVERSEGRPKVLRRRWRQIRPATTPTGRRSMRSCCRCAGRRLSQLSREAAGRPHGPDGSRERQLDAALTDFRGARLRREAQKAKAAKAGHKTPAITSPAAAKKRSRSAPCSRTVSCSTRSSAAAEWVSSIAPSTGAGWRRCTSFRTSRSNC